MSDDEFKIRKLKFIQNLLTMATELGLEGTAIFDGEDGEEFLGIIIGEPGFSDLIEFKEKEIYH